MTKHLTHYWIARNLDLFTMEPQTSRRGQAADLMQDIAHDLPFMEPIQPSAFIENSVYNRFEYRVSKQMRLDGLCDIPLELPSLNATATLSVFSDGSALLAWKGQNGLAASRLVPWPFRLKDFERVRRANGPHNHIRKPCLVTDTIAIADITADCLAIISAFDAAPPIATGTNMLRDAWENKAAFCAYFPYNLGNAIRPQIIDDVLLWLTSKGFHLDDSLITLKGGFMRLDGSITDWKVHISCSSMDKTQAADLARKVEQLLESPDLTTEECCRLFHNKSGYLTYFDSRRDDIPEISAHRTLQAVARVDGLIQRLADTPIQNTAEGVHA